MTDAIKALFEMLVQKDNSGSDYTGTVTRVDARTAYVQFDGSDISDTPVALSIGAKQGDAVRVRVADGRAWLIGNDTAPPNDSAEVAAGLALTNADLSATKASFAEFNTVVTNQLIAHQAVIDNLDATYANITFANINTADISLAKVKDLFVQVGLINNAVIDQGKITGYLDAVEVNAASITAGTLIADRIAIRGSTDSIVYALNNYGQITSTQTNTIDGYILTQRSINANKIVANSITATEITTQNLVGTNGWINLSSGTFAYGGDKLTWNGSTLSVKGVVNATSGSLGGWTLTNRHLYSESNGLYTGLQIQGRGSNAFAIGATDFNDWTTAPFYVTHAGKMTAKSGEIAGWAIGNGRISATVNGHTTELINSYSDTGYPALVLANNSDSMSVLPGELSMFDTPYLGSSKYQLILSSNSITGFNYSIPNDVTFYVNFDNGHMVAGNAFFGKVTVSGTNRSTALLDGYMEFHGNGSSSPSFGTGAYITDDNSGASMRVIINQAGTDQGLYSTGYYSGSSYTSSGKWIIRRDSAGDTHLQAGRTYVIGNAGNERVAAVSNNVDGKKMEGLICNNATQAGMYGQWGVTGNTYKYMYWTVSSSDPRLKNNIRNSEIDALSIIDAIPLHSFDWRTDGRHWSVGFIAPELYDIDPNLTIQPDDEEEGYWGIDDFYLVGVLTKAVQELTARVRQLERRSA